MRRWLIPAVCALLYLFAVRVPVTRPERRRVREQGRLPQPSWN